MPHVFVRLFTLLFLSLFSFASISSTGAIPIKKSKLFKVHSAIFDMFLPFREHEQDSALKNLVTEAKKSTFTNMLKTEELTLALFMLDNLHLLKNKPLLKFYYRSIARDKSELKHINSESLLDLKEYIHDDLNKHSVRKIDIDERLKLLSIMSRSKINLLRQIAYYVRMFYVDAIYNSGIGEKVVGIVNNGAKEADIMPSFPVINNHKLKYNKHKKRFEGHLDLIIVGSGASAIIAGSELQKKGLDIMMIEKGSLVIPGFVNMYTNMKYLESRGPHLSEDGAVGLLNAEVVGGGPAINLDMSFAPTLPYVKHKFHEWHKNKLIPRNLWTDHEIDHAYQKVKSLLGPRVVGEEEINANNMILREGAEALGIPTKRYHLNTYAPGAVSASDISSKKSRFERLILPAMQDKYHPITLLSDCKVEKVLIKHGKAYGVECIYEPRDVGMGIINDINGFAIKPKSKIRVYADEVVLAAGALGSTGILLNSKVKNSNIGRGFVVHPFIPIMGNFPGKKIRADLGEPSTVLLDYFMPTDNHPNRPGFLIEAGLGRITLGALLTPGTPKQIRHNVERTASAGGFAVVLIDEPNNFNRIEVNSCGRTRVFYKISKKDKKRFIKGIKTAVKILFAAGANEVTFSSYEYPFFQFDDLESNALTPDMDLNKVFKKFRLKKNQTNVLAAHLTGTNSIGTAPESSVVNSDYMVWGVDDLYVIDASVFPSSVGANPEMTINTSAMIFAERFSENHGL